jgi:hypothetical protein
LITPGNLHKYVNRSAIYHTNKKADFRPLMVGRFSSDFFI